MKIFIDSADPQKVQEAWETGVIDGVTTNPSLATKAGVPFREAVDKILAVVTGPVSLEVISTDYWGIMDEAEQLAAFGENVVVKIPLLPDGIKAVKHLAQRGIKTNVTLVFSPGQALLAAKAGATYVSPFMGRLDDIAQDGIELVGEIRTLFDNFGYATQILAASERSTRRSLEAGLIGADVVTMKYENFQNLYKHPLTDVGLKKFLEDWDNSNQEPLVKPRG